MRTNKMSEKLNKNYKKTILFWVAVFLLGGLAGILGEKLLIPQIASIAPFDRIGWLTKSQEGTTIINKTEKITISQDVAYQDIISQVSNSVVAVRAEKHVKVVNKKEIPLDKPEILAEGTGFVLTSDGEIVTANVLVPEAATRVIVTKNDGRELAAQIIKRDAESGLALIKIDEANLSVVTLADLSVAKLGEMVFLIGRFNSTSTPSEFVNLGFIKSFLPEVTFNFTEKQLANGSPMVNLKGEVFGLNLIDAQGNIKIAGEDKLRALLK